MGIKVIAWDFDGVLSRNFVNGRFVWSDNFEADTGQSKEVFDTYVFDRDLDAILTGKEDLRDRVAEWAQFVGYAPGPDDLLAYWFAKDARSDPMLLGLMDRIAERGLRQVITTNNEARRAAYIENEMGFGDRVEHVFASGRMGLAKPDLEYFKVVTNALGVHPGDVFLVDDRVENIEAAIQIGWQGMLFTDETRDKLEMLLPI